MRFVTSLVAFFLAAATARQPTAEGAPRVDYCSIDTEGSRIETVRPAPDEPAIDDINWFARPVPNERDDWIIAFASHKQNYLYNLSKGKRVKIPDESDAVATPDGRYMTVPSNYTPDKYIRFYDAHVLLEHLERGEDADTVPPVFIHVHPDLRKVYYQSAGIVTSDERETVYRLMFSGTRDEAGFRIVDYTFRADGSVEPTEPMKLCPEIPNDLNTPFISKDARYVASYTSSSSDSAYSSGSSLKVYRIAGLMPEHHTTRCEEIVDFGFAAGKADFSYDNSQLTFHISKGGYLTPFINGGLVPPTITDVIVVDLDRNADGDITGYSRMARITTSTTEGVGNYFPAFFPDGHLFYIFNSTPKGVDQVKRFSFKVVDPSAELFMANLFADDAQRKLAVELGSLWQSACGGKPFKEHEAPWVLSSLSAEQCDALVNERAPDNEALGGLCDLRR
jgi:hypothetical protein